MVTFLDKGLNTERLRVLDLLRRLGLVERVEEQTDVCGCAHNCGPLLRMKSSSKFQMPDFALRRAEPRWRRERADRTKRTSNCFRYIQLQ